MNHLAYVSAAYAAAFVGVGGLIIWVIGGHRNALARLAKLEAGGIMRRSKKGVR